MITIRKILFSTKSSVQFWLTIIGLFIGVFSALMSVVIYIDVNYSRASNDALFGDHSIVIQKKVTKMTSLGLNSTYFSEEEVERLKSNPSILDIGIFRSANYEVGISENLGDGLPGFYANMFLQSVPSRFIKKVDSLGWGWTENSKYVPVILPKNFLTLVNYGIAPSQGLPQISEDFIKSVRLKLHLIGNNKKGVVLAKVVGFSSQINSVLVPESFIESTNKMYSESGEALPNRLFIEVKAKDFETIQSLIDQMNLDISESSLGISQLKTYVKNIIFFIFIFSALIVLMAAMSILQYSKLMMVNLKTELKLLLKLGYAPQTIAKLIFYKLLKTVLLVISMAFILVILSKFFVIDQILIQNGVISNNQSLIYGILFVLLMIILFIFVVKIEIKRTIIKISKD